MKKLLLFALPLVAMLSVSCSKEESFGAKFLGIKVQGYNSWDYYYSHGTSESHDAVGNLSNVYNIYYGYYDNYGNEIIESPSNTWSVSCNADWCHYRYEEMVENHYGTTRKYISLSYELDNNDTGEERSTTIKVQNGTATCEIHITQNGYSIVNVTTPGTLVDILTAQDLLYAASLKIIGELNEQDLDIIKGLKNATLLDLSEIIIDDLPDRMFYDNKTIKTISLPKSISTIHSSTFRNSSIESVIIPANIERIEDGEWDGYSIYNFYGNGAFSNSNLSSVVFEQNSNLQHLGIAAFYGCPLNKIVIPQSVKIIGDGAFSINDKHYVALAELTIAFEDNSQLENIGTIYYKSDLSSDSSPAIYLDAHNCKKIKTISSIWSQGKYSDWQESVNIKIGTTVPPVVNGSFVNPQILEVPKGCISAYYQADGWKDFAKIIEIE